MSYAQLKIMEQTSAYEQFFQLVRFLNEQRDDRKAIYDLMAKPLTFEKWHPDTKKMGEKVCTGFNLAGILARRGGLLGQLIIDSYRRSRLLFGAVSILYSSSFEPTAANNTARNSTGL